MIMIKGNKIFFDQIKEWKKRSENGEVCGMFGCNTNPEVHCNICGNWYCKEHSLMHFHEMNEKKN